MIRIEKDATLGTISLTSDQPGEVSVQFKGSAPNIGLRCQQILSLTFNKPVTDFEFSVSPARIPFIDEAYLIIKLMNNGKPVEPDRDYSVSFSLDSDIGKLTRDTITIKAGQFEGRTTFIPVKKGEVNITASMPSFLSQSKPLIVDTPVLLLALSAIGGLVGGLIAFWVHDRSKWWRVVVGLVTGFVLYWACIFISLASLPRGVVLNILTALVLPILGGWMGTEVFNLVLKKMGLVQ
jgi:hypothetical protein